MHKSDYLNLDGHLLRLLVLVHDTGSVTAAARKLGVNQSTVSHGLERLRAIIGDPLFVRSGRSIAPTERADALIENARTMVAGMEAMAASPNYDPATDKGMFTIAANDYEVETILKPLLKHCRRAAPHIRLRIIQAVAQKDWAAALQRREIDLVLSPPLSTAESGLAQQVLFQNRHLCFYDPAHQSAPDTLDAYCAAPHAVMLPGGFVPTDIDHQLADLGRSRNVVTTAPSFAMVATLIEGTDIIATMPARLSDTLFQNSVSVDPPLKVEGFAIAQVWHSRNSRSARHQWLRQAVRACVAPAE